MGRHSLSCSTVGFSFFFLYIFPLFLYIKHFQTADVYEYQIADTRYTTAQHNNLPSTGGGPREALAPTLERTGLVCTTASETTCGFPEEGTRPLSVSQAIGEFCRFGGWKREGDACCWIVFTFLVFFIFLPGANYLTYTSYDTAIRLLVHGSLEPAVARSGRVCPSRA